MNRDCDDDYYDTVITRDFCLTFGILLLLEFQGLSLS